MSDTTFVQGTIVPKEWLNDLNDLYYTLFASATTAAAARTALGLDTMATQAASAVAITGGTITGGTITGITDLVVADGGTGRSTATEFAVLCGGTTTTGAHQSIASVGTAGQTLTSNGAGNLPTFQNGAPIRTYKTADVAIQSDNSINADTQLLFSVAANTKYVFTFVIHYNTPAAADFRLDLTGPAAPTALRVTAISTIGGTPGASNFTGFSAGPYDIATGSTVGSLLIYGTLHNGANAGTVTFAWAQTTSTAGDTTVYAGSYVDYQVVA